MIQLICERISKTSLKHCLALLSLVLTPFILYSVYWYSATKRLSLLLLVIVFTILLLTLLVLFGINCLNTLRRNLSVYAAVLSFFCLIFVFIFPPLTVADEDHHFAATYWMANCVTGSGSWTDSSTLLMRPEDAALLFDETNPRISESSYRHILEYASPFSKSEEMVSIDIDEHFTLSINGDNLITKIPSIVGVVLARALNLGSYPLFYLGRIFSCVAYVACCVIAVKKTPVAKSAFIVASMLPMSLNLAASYSYDCGIIGISFLFLSFTLRAIFLEKKLSITELITIAVSATLLAPCKVVYSFEFLLIFLIPTDRFSSKRNGLLFKLGVIACALVSILILRFTTLAAMTTGGTSRHAEPFTLATLLNNPYETISIFARTLIEQGDFYILSSIGSYLGWLQSELGAPFYFIIAYIICALYSVQPSTGDSSILSARHKVLFFVIGTLILFSSMLALLLDWTSFGSSIIQGVQGRYLLPVMPLIIMLFRCESIKNNTNALPFSLVSISAINTFYMVQFFARALLLF
ncbi:DUF2142 domain-containing protein [Thermophilibacter provencensis]|uniref:DUF2142 domain-containing protein n=1 Tax=Thermophilibacter provencensis TaxID=1852386 RepID=UPI002942298B|nr:DUF2142 domain-containing protein [Thermophilibacter provencensis]